MRFDPCGWNAIAVASYIVLGSSHRVSVAGFAPFPVLRHAPSKSQTGTRTQNGGCRATTSASSFPVVDSESNFWFTTTTDDDEDQFTLPCVPTLDAEGALPTRAYLYRSGGDDSSVVKPQCRVQMQWKDDAAASRSVEEVQDCIDDGWTTFQRTNRSRQQQQLHKLLLDSTPRTVMDRCSISIPYDTTFDHKNDAIHHSFYHQSVIRSVVHNHLSYLGTNSIDVLRIAIPPSKSSMLQYWELLEHVRDLHREGVIRSVAVETSQDSLAHHFIQQGYRIDSVHCDTVNLLNPPGELMVGDEQQMLWKTAQNPFAGDWLIRDPLAFSSAPVCPEDANWAQHVVSSAWANMNTIKKRHLWSAFETQILRPLHHLARCHDVSPRILLLRWLLQQGDGYSATVPMPNRNKINNDSLRNVFRMHLDDTDMQALQTIAGIDSTSPASMDWKQEYSAQLQPTKSGLFLPPRRKIP